MSEPSQSTNISLPSAAAAQGFYGTGNSQTNSTWIIMAFVAFLVIIWGIWRSHAQTSDTKQDLTNSIHQGTLAASLNAQRLGDIQQSLTLNQLATTQFREADLRFGSPVGFHTVPFPQGRRGGGTVVNGGGISESFQADNSVF